MSELTLCNWHSLQLVKDKYGKANVTVKRETDGWYAVSVKSKPDPVAWFMELSDRCVC